MSSILEQSLQCSIGVNYLVPQPWWEQFYSINATNNSSNFIYPSLNTVQFMQIQFLISDTFLLEFKEQIIDEISNKCNYLKFRKVVLSPEPISKMKWKLINPNLWKLIAKNTKAQPIYTYYAGSMEKIFSLTQVQIVFCSGYISDLFVGYLPKQAPLLNIIRQLGYQMGFIQMQNSKIIFPDHYAEKNLRFELLENVTVQKAKDSFMMIYNLQCNEETSPLAKIPNFANDSHEAVAGDLMTMVDESRVQLLGEDGTLSTGAQTPFSFFGSEGYDIDRQYRVNELFRDKKPQQIQQMKFRAKKLITGDLIQVPTAKQEVIQQQLDKIADQILQTLHIHKKKGKQKQNSNIYQ